MVLKNLKNKIRKITTNFAGIKISGNEIDYGSGERVSPGVLNIFLQ